MTKILRGLQRDWDQPVQTPAGILPAQGAVLLLRAPNILIYQNLPVVARPGSGRQAARREGTEKRDAGCRSPGGAGTARGPEGAPGRAHDFTPWASRECGPGALPPGYCLPPGTRTTVLAPRRGQTPGVGQWRECAGQRVFSYSRHVTPNMAGPAAAAIRQGDGCPGRDALSGTSLWHKNCLLILPESSARLCGAYAHQCLMRPPRLQLS